MPWDLYTRCARELHELGVVQPGAFYLDDAGTVRMMIAFKDESPLEKLIGAINAANAEIRRPDDRIRLFQVPLERVV